MYSLALPVGIREQKVGRVGVAPTVFLTCLIYSQVVYASLRSLLGIPAHKKTACVEILQTDGLQPLFFGWSLS